MKVLIIVVGVLLVLLALLLFVGAVVLFFIARGRRTNAAQQPSVVPVVPAAPPVTQVEATVVVDLEAARSWGALHGVSGSVEGRVFPIDASGFYVGRDRQLSQVVVDSPQVSKRHVWVGVKDGAVVAIDQQSTNGTFLNMPGNRLTQARLSEGDTLILAGDVARLTYRP